MAKYVKPTLDTKFHIDFGWWQKHGQNLRSHLQSQACPQALEQLAGEEAGQTFDWIDPDTGEVFQINILWYLVHKSCSQRADFIDQFTPLTTAIFRIFLTNNNTPLTPVEIYQQIHKKTPEVILRTIGGHTVYQGIRPVTTPV
ncbi:MAG: hypothetical protein AB1801_27435 [Chloroflexota bacterium]